jgi:hypothetical protein
MDWASTIRKDGNTSLLYVALLTAHFAYYELNLMIATTTFGLYIITSRLFDTLATHFFGAFTSLAIWDGAFAFRRTSQRRNKQRIGGVAYTITGLLNHIGMIMVFLWALYLL